MWQLPPEMDPKGICATCAHFINDLTELSEEFQYVARNYPQLVSSERIVKGTFKVHTREGAIETLPIHDAAKVGRKTADIKDVAQFIWDRMRIPPSDLGLCDQNVARFVARSAGSGGPSDQCAKWKVAPEGSRPVRVRPIGWRSAREKALPKEGA
jgi:hypothetical protein